MNVINILKTYLINKKKFFSFLLFLCFPLMAYISYHFELEGKEFLYFMSFLFFYALLKWQHILSEWHEENKFFNIIKEFDIKRQLIRPKNEKNETIIIFNNVGLEKKANQISDSFIFKIFEKVINNFNQTKSVSNSNKYSEYLFDKQREYLDNQFVTLKYFCWLIPTIGFIGTVLGISNGIEKFKSIIGQNRQDLLSSAISDFGSAFDTTFVALILGAFLVGLISRRERLEEKFLLKAEHYVSDEFLANFLKFEQNDIVSYLLKIDNRMIKINNKMIKILKCFKINPNKEEEGRLIAEIDSINDYQLMNNIESINSKIDNISKSFITDDVDSDRIVAEIYDFNSEQFGEKISEIHSYLYDNKSQIELVTKNSQVLLTKFMNTLNELEKNTKDDIQLRNDIKELLKLVKNDTDNVKNFRDYLIEFEKRTLIFQQTLMKKLGEDNKYQNEQIEVNISSINETLNNFKKFSLLFEKNFEHFQNEVNKGVQVSFDKKVPFMEIVNQLSELNNEIHKGIPVDFNEKNILIDIVNKLTDLNNEMNILRNSIGDSPTEINKKAIEISEAAYMIVSINKTIDSCLNQMHKILEKDSINTKDIKKIIKQFLEGLNQDSIKAIAKELFLDIGEHVEIKNISKKLDGIDGKIKPIDVELISKKIYNLIQAEIDGRLKNEEIDEFLKDIDENKKKLEEDRNRLMSLKSKMK